MFMPGDLVSIDLFPETTEELIMAEMTKDVPCRELSPEAFAPVIPVLRGSCGIVFDAYPYGESLWLAVLVSSMQRLVMVQKKHAKNLTRATQTWRS